MVNVQLEAARLLDGRDPAGARSAIEKAQTLTQEGLRQIRCSVAALRSSTPARCPATPAGRMGTSNSHARFTTVYEYQGIGSMISYAWLQQYGLPTDSSSDYADPDHDAPSNWQECICGTNPTNALSALRMVSALPTGTNATAAWQSVAGVDYFLERNANLAAPFTLLATNIVGQASTTSVA